MKKNIDINNDKDEDVKYIFMECHLSFVLNYERSGLRKDALKIYKIKSSTMPFYRIF